MSGASEFGKDLGLLHEAVVTGRKAGWDRKEWADLAHSEVLMRHLLPIVRGFIDCSVPPHIPPGWSIRPEDQIASRVTGQIIWDPSKIRLFLDPAQEGDGLICGVDLLEKLKGQPVLPVNVLDFLLGHQDLILLDYEGTAFWGTIYRDPGGYLCVPCLCRDGGRWDWCGRWPVNAWHVGHPAAVLAAAA